MLKATLVSLALILGGAAQAQMYSAAQLAQTEGRSADLIRLVLREDIVGNLPQSQVADAAGVTVEFPDQGNAPLSFWADLGAREIAMPLASLRLFGDLSLVYAWFDHHGCNVAPVQGYMLRVMAQQPVPPPLEAFGLTQAQVIGAGRPDPIRGSTTTDSLSQKLFGSAIYFILAHELGHIVLGHSGMTGGAMSQAQEWEADRFALAHFAREGTAPLGILYVYMSTWWTDPVGKAQAAAGSHPLSSARVAAIAEALAADPEAYSWREADPQAGAQLVMYVSQQLSQIATIAADDELRAAAVAALIARYPLASLPDTCP